MKFKDVEADIVTGDAILVDGKGIVSELIEVGTDGDKSHAGIFFRLDAELADLLGGFINDLYVGEMWLGKSFDVHPANRYLSDSDGTCYLGVAPAAVRMQQDKVLDKIKWFIKTQPVYGLKEFPLMFADRIFHIQIDPNTILPVCSVALQECWELCGVHFKISLAAPTDFDDIVAGTVQIEL